LITEDRSDPNGAASIRLLRVPLAPITGVRDTAQAVDQLSSEVQAFTHTAEALPQQIRWQTEMLLFEIDRLESVAALQQQMTAIRQQFESLAGIAERLPERARLEIEAALAGADPVADKIGAILSDAREVTQDLIKALERAEEVTRTAASTAQEAARTGEAWERTAGSAQSLLSEVRSLMPPATGPSDPSAPSAIQELSAAADRLHATVAEARSLVSDLERLGSQSGSIVDEIERVRTSTVSAIAAELQNVQNGLFLRGAALVALALVGAAGLLLIPRISRARRRAAQVHPQP